MIEFEKLDKVVKIWLISVTNVDREEYVGFADNSLGRGYYIKQDLERLLFNRNVYIIKAPRKEGTDFFISFDDVSNTIIGIAGPFVHYLEYKKSKYFTDSDIRKLIEMIKEPDKVINENLKKNPEFDMNNEIELSEIILTENGCDILFMSSTDLEFDQYNDIYVGFKVDEILYPFQITEKHIKRSYKYNPPIYRATYTGNRCIDSGSTELLFNATFRKIISERMINAIIHDDANLL